MTRGWLSPRRPRDHSPADEFLQNQNDPQLPELKERLKNSFQYFGDDMLMTGGIGEWAAPLQRRRLARSAAVGRASRMAQRKQRARSGDPDSSGRSYEAVNKEFDITGQRWMVHHVPVVNNDLLTRLQRMGCGVQMAAFRWVTSTDPKVVVGAAFRTIVDHGIQVGIHGDGVHIAPLNPWLQIYFATTGVNSFGARVNGDQQITRQRLSVSSHAAIAGSCEWRTRLARLNQAGWLTSPSLIRTTMVPDVEIKQIRSVLTIVDGARLQAVHNEI